VRVWYYGEYVRITKIIAYLNNCFANYGFLATEWINERWPWFQHIYCNTKHSIMNVCEKWLMKSLLRIIYFLQNYYVLKRLEWTSKKVEETNVQRGIVVFLCLFPCFHTSIIPMDLLLLLVFIWCLCSKMVHSSHIWLKIR
jgi:hypothetical protein